MSTNRPWQIDGDAAVLNLGDFSGRVSLAASTDGLTEQRLREKPIAGRLWGWKVGDRRDDNLLSEQPCADAYVRGNDLVLTYSPTDARPFETQVYWTAERSNGLARLTLLVSIRTSLLDTEPVILVGSTRPVAATLLSTADSADKFSEDADPRTATALLQRTTDNGPSFFEACHPDDQSLLSLAEDRVDWRLFAHFLEKGVIRRARLTAAVVPEADDIDAAGKAAAEFLSEPLPLTT